MGNKYPSKGVLTLLYTIYEKVETIMGFVCCGLLIVITVFAISIEVLTRILFSYSFMGLIEMTSLFMAVITFASIAVIQRSNKHILIDLFEAKLSGSRIGILIKCVNSMLCSAIASLLCYVTGVYTLKIYLQQRTTEILHVPYWPFAILIPIGLLFFAIRTGIQFAGQVRELMPKGKASD